LGAVILAAAVLLTVRAHAQRPERSAAGKNALARAGVGDGD
jgi:hypothetical protein